MKIVTWNLGGKRFRAKNDLAWRFMLEDLAADVVLAQEAALEKPVWLRELVVEWRQRQ